MIMKDRSPLRLEKCEPLVMRRSPDLEPFYVLSPYVWKDAAERYSMLVRVVNRDDDPHKKVARVHNATSVDGLDFTMGDKAVIPPGAPGEDDDGGCEDPTAVQDGGTYFVFYSGYSIGENDAMMLCASGRSLSDLKKRGRVLPESDWYRNSKEAAVVRAPDGRWRMFFEYSAEKASKIGLATAPSLEGPWSYEPFDFAARPELWDSCISVQGRSSRRTHRLRSCCTMALPNRRTGASAGRLLTVSTGSCTPAVKKRSWNRRGSTVMQPTSPSPHPLWSKRGRFGSITRSAISA